MSSCMKSMQWFILRKSDTSEISREKSSEWSVGSRLDQALPKPLIFMTSKNWTFIPPRMFKYILH